MTTSAEGLPIPAAWDDISKLDGGSAEGLPIPAAWDDISKLDGGSAEGIFALFLFSDFMKNHHQTYACSI
jgi:hypothetical protein